MALTALGATGCFGLVPLPDEPTSVGTTSEGYLVMGASLPDEGEGFERGRRGEATRYGVPRLVAALERAGATVAREAPGSGLLRVGDLGSELGGAHLRHRSHRAGRDVDVLFYLTDAAGRPAPSRGFLAVSRFGTTLDEDGHVFFLDEERNWRLVRALLTDPEIDVQWIFCSRGVKSRLLRWALEHEDDPDLLVRAAYVLQQPENALPHDDHFHVRLYCSTDERARGCRDTGPRWPWLRPEIEDVAGRDGPGLDDETLIDALVAE